MVDSLTSFEDLKSSKLKRRSYQQNSQSSSSPNLIDEKIKKKKVSFSPDTPPPKIHEEDYLALTFTQFSHNFEEKYTLYEIKLLYFGHIWIIQKRYSDFLNFHKALSTELIQLQKKHYNEYINSMSSISNSNSESNSEFKEKKNKDESNKKSEKLINYEEQILLDFVEGNANSPLTSSPFYFPLPSLPKKRWFEKQRWINKFDDNYAKKRLLSLQDYLRILARIPLIRDHSKVFHQFIKTPSNILEIVRNFNINNSKLLEEYKKREEATKSPQLSPVSKKEKKLPSNFQSINVKIETPQVSDVALESEEIEETDQLTNNNESDLLRSSDEDDADKQESDENNNNEIIKNNLLPLSLKDKEILNEKQLFLSTSPNCSSPLSLSPSSTTIPTSLSTINTTEDCESSFLNNTPSSSTKFQNITSDISLENLSISS